MMKEKILAICVSVDDSIDFSSTVLMDDGVMSSLTLVEIISELSDAFDIEIPYEDIVPDNFNSIDAMVTLVQRYV